MRGILAWEAKRADIAISLFAKSNSPIGNQLIARVDQLVKDSQASALLAMRATQDAAANRAYGGLLEIAGIGALRADIDKLTAAIRRKRFTEQEVAAIKRHLQLLDGELAQTQLAEDVRPVLACFALVRPDIPLEVDQAKLDEVLARLKKDNTKEVINAIFTVQNNGLSLSFENQPTLVDISALSSLPLTSLRFVYSRGLSDLGPLKGLPLTSLEFQYCAKVKDLSPLKSLPLKVLHIWGASTERLQLEDLSPLKGMSIEDLAVTYSSVSDLSPLKGMPLKRLSIEGSTSVVDIRPLKGMPLKWLKVPVSVSDLSPVNRIEGLQLER